MRDGDIGPVIRMIKKDLAGYMPPVSTMAAEGANSFKLLIATVLSSRTKDEVSGPAAERLILSADTPQKMLDLGEDRIKEAIYPVGFYNTKARNIISLCRDLIEKYDSRVPESIDELLKLPGVGRKTANLVVSLAFGGAGICVDVHVHRISNRLGYVQTRTPEQTEMALRAKLPRRYWHVFNTLLVGHGQKTCRPVSPFCSRCPVFRYCDRVGVTESR
ncbi:MAG: endonuclease III [Syntrophaceae bacterium]|jgi:endonuclease-3